MAFIPEVRAGVPAEANLLKANWDTDTRVYTLVVLGRLLQGAALVGCGACLACAVFIHSSFVLGMILAMAIISAGESLAQARLWVDGTIDIPGFTSHVFVPGQPVGLHRQNNNCCINAPLQFAMASQSAEDLMRQMPEANALREIYDAYRRAQNTSQPIAGGAVTQRVREFISRFATPQNPRDPLPISPSSGRMEDAGEVFCFILDALERRFNELHQGEQPAPLPGFMNRMRLRWQTREGQRDEQRVNENRANLHLFDYLERLALPAEHARAIPADLGEEQIFLQYIVDPYFNDRNQYGPSTRRFITPPTELFFQLMRFDGAQRKNNAEVPAPMQFTLPGAYVETGEPCRMEVDAFFVHYGRTPRTGHYIAYVKTAGGVWWEINDHRARPLYEAEARTALRNSYNIHCRRIPPA